MTFLYKFFESNVHKLKHSMVSKMANIRCIQIIWLKYIKKNLCWGKPQYFIVVDFFTLSLTLTTFEIAWLTVNENSCDMKWSMFFFHLYFPVVSKDICAEWLTETQHLQGSLLQGKFMISGMTLNCIFSYFDHVLV